jgi:purine nucleosidase
VRHPNIAVVATNGPTKIRGQAALTLLQALHCKTIPVFQGISRSLSKVPAFTHGNEHVGVSATMKPKQFRHLLAWLHWQNNRSVTIVATAPLTTTAQLIIKKDICVKIANIVLMGGSFPFFGIPVKEHNFTADPIAIQIVQASDIPLFVVPLNTTLSHPLFPSELEKIKKSISPAGKLIRQWMNTWLEVTRKFSGEDRIFSNTIFLHDPLTVMAAIHPENFSWKRIAFQVDHQGIVRTGGKKRCFVATEASINAVTCVKNIITSL